MPHVQHVRLNLLSLVFAIFVLLHRQDETSCLVIHSISPNGFWKAHFYVDESAPYFTGLLKLNSSVFADIRQILPPNQQLFASAAGKQLWRYYRGVAHPPRSGWQSLALSI